MAELASEVIPVTIEDELKQSYLDYAMSVIVGRALPDVRDGLKPVHRRVLFAMSELNNDWNKPYKKSARVVGDVIGKYHPHGDTAVYDTIVRMAQPFSLRYCLIDGQGNFGSIDGDPPAAMRYTEIRMMRISHALLADLDKQTVDFVPNYDGNEMMPSVLPTQVPNLLVNGSSGIAVGMATNIPTHNLTEVINATLALIDDPDISLQGLLAHLPGPDFPTKGIINGRAGILSAYRTGRGRIYLRGRAGIEEHPKTGRQAIIITELPYQVNKAKLIEKIAELVKLKKLDGISELRDESDKDGMRIFIGLKKGEPGEVILNNLYAQTQLQTVFGINMVALVHGQPKLLTLKQTLDAFISHRREVVTRRTVFELNKAKDRGHLLEGLGVALANIDPIIALIKQSKTPAEAKEKLLETAWEAGLVLSMLEKDERELSRPEGLLPIYGLQDDQKTYRLSPEQAQAILDLRLHRLTALEHDKIINEYKDILAKIRELLTILQDPEKLMAVIRDELNQIKAQFGDERQTEIIESQHDLNAEDLITEEDVVVTLSQAGYVKTQSLDNYSAQRRGGRGKAATKMRDEDFVQRLLIASTHDTILCFSSIGKVYWLKVYQLPQAGRTSRGKPIVNLLPLAQDERITTILPVREYSEDQFVFMATALGTVKKVALSDFSRPRNSGIIAVGLNEGDHLIGADITDGSRDVMIFSDEGKVIRFNEEKVRPMGRSARGVRGISLKPDHNVISLVVVEEKGAILTATEKGYGKRTVVDEYRQSGRGGQGVISIQVNERNGNVVSAVQVTEDDEVMLITDGGTLVRTRVHEISKVGRNTQGVRLINLNNGERLVEVQRIADLNNAEENTEVSMNNDKKQSIDFIVRPQTQLKGIIECPGDKSISHRIAILAALASGRSVIRGFLQSEDCLATLKVLQQLGVPINLEQDTVMIDGVGLQGLTPTSNVLDCGNSGTSMRLLTGILAAQSFDSVLTGDHSLQKRPMQRIVEPLTQMGADIKTTNGSAPLYIKSAKHALNGIAYNVPMASAQVQSCVLFAGLYARDNTTVTVPGVVRDHSVNVLKAVGVEVEQDTLCVSLTPPKQLNPIEMTVPGDLSSAAFFIAGSLIAKHGNVIIKHVGINPTRTGVISILQAMGADIQIQNKQIISGEPVADLHVKSSQLKGVEILKSWVDLSIDELPIVLIAASCAEGQTVLRHARELRVKECDRLYAMAEGLRTLGVDVTLLEDGMVINGRADRSFDGGVVRSFDDHRIAMSFAMSCLRAKSPICIQQCENIATSFPNFIEVAKQLGLSIEVSSRHE